MNIDDVNRGIEPHRKKKRVGRGIGSGHGKTSGRGHKGQSSHAGWKAHPTFQGGSMPLVRRVPKRGFHNPFARQVAAINVEQLESAFEDGAAVDLDALRAARLLKGRWDEVKILGDGELTKKLKVSAHRFSASAKEKIEKAGGEIVVLAGRTPVAVHQKRAKAAKVAAGQGGSRASRGGKPKPGRAKS